MIKESEELIAQSDIVLLELEIPFETVRFAAELAKIHGKTVILNPKPPEILDDAFLKNIDIIVPNDLTCGTICDMEIKSTEDYKEASEYLYGKGIKHVIVNLGIKVPFITMELSIKTYQHRRLKPSIQQPQEMLSLVR